VGQPTAKRTAGTIRPTEPEYPRVKCSCGTGSDQAAGSAATHDASRCGFADGTGLRVDRGDPGTICLWQADRERPGLAAKVSALSDASRTGNRQGSDGTQAGGPPLLDVAEGMGLRASEEVRFARGTARKSSGCAAITDRMIGRPAPLKKGEFEEVIMIEVVIEEMVEAN
jgi:hypothetical protein